MHYPKVLEQVDSPEQIFHRSFSLGAPESLRPSTVHPMQTDQIHIRMHTTRVSGAHVHFRVIDTCG